MSEDVGGMHEHHQGMLPVVDSVDVGKRDDLHKLQDQLTGQPGIDMVAPFGNSLHVSGRDRAALEATIAPFRESHGWHWQHSEPSLEDVFIELMTRSKDNFQ